MPQHSQINVVINGYDSTIRCGDKYVSVSIYDTERNGMYMFIQSEFRQIRDLYLILHDYSPNIIQYFNPTEEQLFQYNTIMDFSTMQAIVHLHHYIINNDKLTTELVLRSISKCIKENEGKYSIVIPVPEVPEEEFIEEVTFYT